MADIVDILEI